MYTYGLLNSWINAGGYTCTQRYEMCAIRRVYPHDRILNYTEPFTGYALLEVSTPGTESTEYVSVPKPAGGNFPWGFDVLPDRT